MARSRTDADGLFKSRWIFFLFISFLCLYELFKPLEFGGSITVNEQNTRKL